jgi:hypothetical protein
MGQACAVRGRRTGGLGRGVIGAGLAVAGGCLAAARPAAGRAQVRIKSTVLGAQPNAAVGIVVGAEFQPVRSALFVVNVGKIGRFATTYRAGSCRTRW